MDVQAYQPVTKDGVFAKKIVIIDSHNTVTQAANVYFPFRFDLNNTALAVKYLKGIVDEALEDKALGPKIVDNNTEGQVNNAKNLRDIISAIISDPTERIGDYVKAVENSYAQESRLFLGSHIGLQSAYLGLDEIKPGRSPSYASLIGAMQMHSKRNDGLGFMFSMTMRIDRPTISYDQWNKLGLEDRYRGMIGKFDGYCPEFCANLEVQAAVGREITLQEIKEANKWLLDWADGNFDFFQDSTLPLLDNRLFVLLKNLFQDSDYFLTLLDSKPGTKPIKEVKGIEPWKAPKKK